MPTVTGSAHSTEGKSCHRPLQDRRLKHLIASLFSRVALLGLLNGLFFMSLAFPVAAEWNAPYFQIFPIDPWKAGGKPAAGSNTSFPNEKQLNAQMAGIPLPSAIVPVTIFLNDIGAIYSRIGLLEPTTFGPKVDLDSSIRGVFMYEFTGTAQEANTTDIGIYVTACDDELRYKQPWMAINADLGSRFSDAKIYQAIAHELFHPIQARYPYDNCKKIPSWVEEGMADAAGNFLVELELGGDIEVIANDLTFYGLRPYDVPLYNLDVGTAWTNGAIKDRFKKVGHAIKPRTIGYLTSSFWRFLMDRYGNLPATDINRLKALDYFMNRSTTATTQLDWLNWVASGTENKKTLGEFSHLYAEFLAEFAAWPGEKYRDFNPSLWLDIGFGDCEKVTLSYNGKNTKPITITKQDGAKFALYPVAGRCIQVTVNDLKPGDVLHLQLEFQAETNFIANQLVLGFAREEHQEVKSKKVKKTKLVDNCYALTHKIPKKAFPCLFYGKIQKMKGEEEVKGIRTWRFEARKAVHSTQTTTFVLTNIEENPSATQGIKELKGVIGFPHSKGFTNQGRLSIATVLTPDMLPDPSIPKRQQLYGIKKNSGVSGLVAMLNPVNLGTFQVDALDESGNKTERYNIMAMQPVAFGQTGPFQAVVSNKSGDSNALCELGSEPVGNIIRSDDEVLTFTIKTPLCEFSPDNMAACQNGCPVVDHFEGELSLPFGYRYFSENQIEDVVTPGVLLDIDRYHHNVFGTPFQGLGGDDAGPGGGNSGGPGGSLNIGGKGGLPVGNPLLCDCSCENNTQLNEAYDNMTASKDTLPDLNAALQIAQCRLKCRKPFRECRRTERQAQQTH